MPKYTTPHFLASRDLTQAIVHPSPLLSQIRCTESLLLHANIGVIFPLVTSCSNLLCSQPSRVLILSIFQNFPNYQIATIIAFSLFPSTSIGEDLEVPFTARTLFATLTQCIPNSETVTDCEFERRYSSEYVV
jgi:hypothetical protein